MSKIRLMQITHDLAIGGLQQVVVNICRNIDREKFDVVVLCLRELGDFVPSVEKLGIKVIYLPQKKSGTDYLSFLKVARILKDENIDVIHTHNTNPFFDGTLGAILSGVKTIIHTDHVRSFPDKYRYMFAEWLLSHYAYKIVGVSDDTCNNLAKYEYISRKKLMTIVNGIDEQIYNIVIDKNIKRKELGIKSSNGYVIGIGARLSIQKGITYLLQAMPTILRKYPDITLVIAGQGPCKEDLQAETDALGIEKNVMFLGPRLDMNELLKVFDVFVLPSVFEGLPMVLLECMASGCPIIATDVGGNSTAITHRINGSLIESGNPENLANEIIEVLGNEKLRNKYIKNSYEIFKNKFSAKKMTMNYQNLYIEAYKSRTRSKN